MTRPAILVPFKATGSKSRLAGALGAAGAREFALVMLSDVLRMLRSAGGSADTFLVSSDRRAKVLADKHGAATLTEPHDRGVDRSVRKGMLDLKGRSQFVVFPSDLPFLRTEDVTRVLAFASAGFTVICPSASFNGTNAMALERRQRRMLSYDKDSFWTHLARSARAGARVAVLTEPGITFDVDDPADLRALAESGVRNASARYAIKALSR